MDTGKKDPLFASGQTRYIPDYAHILNGVKTAYHFDPIEIDTQPNTLAASSKAIAKGIGIAPWVLLSSRLLTLFAASKRRHHPCG